MSPDVHPDFKYSALIHSDDIDLVAAMRGLAWSCQLTGQKAVSSSGTGEDKWRAQGHHAKFYFTNRAYRDAFIEKTKRLFSSGWNLVESKDDEIGAPKSHAY